MPFSRAQLQELDAAVKANNLEKIDVLLKPHWKLGDFNTCDSKYKFNDIESSFLTACRFELKSVTAKYLELRTYNKLTLSNALYDACNKGSIDIVKLLIEKGNADPNEPYNISLFISKSSPNYEKLKDNEYPLCAAIHNKRDDVIKYLVSLKNLDINKVFNIQNGKHDTYLLLADIYNQVDTCKLLLEHGANPLIQTTYKSVSYSFHTKIDAFADHFPDKLDTAMLEMYSEWLSKNKHREHELNVEAARIAGAHYSEPHSSGSNSPASAGSPDSSPPRQSPLFQKTPPDSPAGSRNGSPPGSPIHKSDSGSSGSAGSSPEKIYAPKVTPTVASSLDKTNNSTAKAAASDARDHELKDMLGTATFNADLEKAKALYDSGKITFNCNCFKCSVLEENVLHVALRYKGKSEVTLAKYMLDHSKYPVDINLTNKDKRTFLHIVAKRKFEGDNRPLINLKNLFLNYGDKYHIDINAKDKDGNTPLHLAGANGNAELVAELLKHKADCSVKNNEGLEPYDYAARECKDAQNKAAVLAVMPKVTAVTSSQDKANSSTAKVTATDARDHELKDIANSKLEANLEKAKALYDSGKITFNCNCMFCSVLEENVLHGVLRYKSKTHVNFAEYMLDHPKYPVDINITNKDKRTFLHLVAKRKFDLKNSPLDELKNLFLNYGEKYHIDVNAKDKDGNTPLHLAGANGNAELVAELLKHKADCSVKNNEGLEPYDYAARECKDAQNKAAVLAVMPKGSIVVSTPLAARSSSANTPIVTNNVRGAPSSVTTSYVGSRAGVFSERQDSYSIPSSTPVQRAQPAQIGAIYASPPLTPDQLPRPFKKPDMVIMPPEATPVQASENKSKSAVANKLKGILGK